MSEPRDSLPAQVGYLTGKVENLDERLDELDIFLRNHMTSEEVKIARIYKLLALMAAVIVLQSAGFSLKQIFDLGVSVLL